MLDFAPHFVYMFCDWLFPMLSLHLMNSVLTLSHILTGRKLIKDAHWLSLQISMTLNCIVPNTLGKTECVCPSCAAPRSHIKVHALLTGSEHCPSLSKPELQSSHALLLSSGKCGGEENFCVPPECELAAWKTFGILFYSELLKPASYCTKIV